MQKIARLKPYKATPPMETVQRIKKILRDNDISVVEVNHNGDVFTGFCSCRIEIDREKIADLKIGANGKGMDPEYSLASGYAEFMERLQNGYLIPFVPKDAMEVSKEDYASAVHNFLIGEYGSSEQSEEVVEKYLNNYSGENLLVPFTDFSTSKTFYFPSNLIDHLCGSNGLAAGNNYLEAILQGVSELFERYAQYRIMVCGDVPPQIDKIWFEDTEVLRRLKMLDMTGIKYYIFDASLGMGLPVIALVLEKDDMFHIHFGADPSPITALERCLTEAYQGNDNLNHLFFSDTISAGADKLEIFNNFRKQCHNATGKIPRKLFAEEKSWDFTGFLHPVSFSDENDLTYYIDVIKSLHSRLYIRKTGVLGFPSVRVYIPGISASFMPEPELYQESLFPKEITEYFRRILTLDEPDWAKFALLLRNWIMDRTLFPKVEFAVKNAIFKTIPMGVFPCKSWDPRLLVAAVYIRGGLEAEGKCLFDNWASERVAEKDIIEGVWLRLHSKSLMFFPSQWPSCPNCKDCQSVCYCRQNDYNFYSEKLSNVLRSQ